MRVGYIFRDSIESTPEVSCMCRLRLPLLPVALLALVSVSVPPAHGQENARDLLAQRKFSKRVRPGKVAYNQASIMRSKSEELGLSEETLAALDSLMEEIRKERNRYKRKMVNVSKGLESLLNENRPSEEALVEKTTEINAAVLEYHLAQMRITLKLRSLLSPEQLEKFMELRTAALDRSRELPKREEPPPVLEEPPPVLEQTPAPPEPP